MKGTYTIILSCSASLKVKIGRLGYAKIRRGIYVYTGSALGKGAVSLEGRIKRHSRARKKARWHVDYLTSKQYCSVKAAIYLESTRQLECQISSMICKKLGGQPLLLHVGASDCGCDGHLLVVDSSLTERSAANQIWAIYSEFGEPTLLLV